MEGVSLHRYCFSSADLLVNLRISLFFRHWVQICEQLQCSFDQTSSDFTLEKIISLGLDKYTDKICEISGAASKELSIEKVRALPLVYADALWLFSTLPSGLLSFGNTASSWNTRVCLSTFVIINPAPCSSPLAYPIPQHSFHPFCTHNVK